MKMFLHNLKYELLSTLRHPAMIFWLMLFPIFLGTVFKIGFGSIYEKGFYYGVSILRDNAR